MRATCFVCLLGVLLMVPATGCGGGSSTPPTGLVTVSAMDDPAVDVGTFALQVESMNLRGPLGEDAALLRGPVTVDFAAAMNAAVLLAIVEVPAGEYDRLHLVLDYATLEARRTDGTPLDVRDETTGDVLQDRVQLLLQLRDTLRVGPGEPAHLLLDYQLGQSLEAVEGAADRVRVRSLLQLRTQTEATIQTRFEGRLASVEPNGGGQGFAVDVEPPDGGARVRLRFQAHEGTDCNGPDDGGQGEPGLVQMQSRLQERVMVSAQLGAGQADFTAHEVCYGGSLPGDAIDVAMGYVAGFDGTTYAILGARVTQASGAEEHGEELTAVIDATTPILKRGELVAPQAIGVGQHVMLAGTLTPGTPPVLDCTEAAGGSVRLLETTALGLVVSTTPGNPESHLLMQLTHFGQYPAEAFALVGHGVDPDAYDVLTAAPLAGILPGDPVVCRGFVLGAGDVADFEALEVTLQEATDSVLSVSWGLPGIDDPFQGATSFPLLLDLTGTYLAQVSSQHGTVVTPLSGAPLVQLPAGGAAGPFAIREGGEITLYDGLEVGLWLADLNQRLGAGARAVRLTGLGEFVDGDPQVYTADSLSITVR